MNRSTVFAGALTCATLLIAVGVLPAAAPGAQQLAWTAAPVAFEVASIKPNPATNGPSTIICHGTDAAMPPNSQPPLGRCAVTRRVLIDIIAWAYGVQRPLITGGPSWVGSDAFDIAAKAEDPTTTSREKFQLMLQSLLADRFKLSFHREAKEGPGFELVTTKNGPNVKESDGLKAPQGVFVSPDARGNVILTGNGAAMWRLATVLSTTLGRPVIDKTGLAGIYDFKLAWTKSEGESGSDPRTADPTGPSIFSAIQDQLGLRLESQKNVPFEVFVIDRAEKPTEP